MRNQEIPHFFVDACAGSGIVQSWDDRAIDGSPLIMAKTRSIVENEIKDKTKKEEVRCVFIEYDEQTYTRLLKNTEPYQSFCTRLRGDTNELLPNQLDKIKDAFALIYIDPFGVGNPVIRFETVKRVLERSHTELFIHFSLEAVERSAGLLKNWNPTTPPRSQAEETVHTIDSYMNDQSWRDAWTEGVSASDRRKRLLDLYVSSLRKYYDNIKWMEMPIGRRDPRYLSDLHNQKPHRRQDNAGHNGQGSKRRNGRPDRLVLISHPEDGPPVPHRVSLTRVT